MSQHPPLLEQSPLKWTPVERRESRTATNASTRPDAIKSEQASARPAGSTGRLLSRLVSLSVALAVTMLGGCDMRGSVHEESTRLGPRIVQFGQPVPKGGGRYKLGEPYRVNGRVYVPREHGGYDQTGLASWYGELFHGRRTANGEIYDMEALTAAHPTLPIPSYVRVTNLYNGRSVVVRVNDRGPYAHGRIIDLSWATASLLEIERPGVAKVRVQYLGNAPMDGDDGYERRMLADQPWAGPRVAFAKSPAKAMRGHRPAPADYAENRRRTAPAREAAARAVPAFETAEARSPRPPEARPAKPAAQRPETRPQRFAAAAAPGADAPEPATLRSPAPLPATPTQNPVPDYVPFRPATLDAAPDRPRPVRSAAPRTRPDKVPAREAQSRGLSEPPAAAPKPSAPTRHRAAASAPYLGGQAAAPAYFVEAGIFPERPLAERLAAILNDIAPASIETVTHQGRPAHRIRLGPFPEGDAANAAAARIRAAGLTGARLEGGT